MPKDAYWFRHDANARNDPKMCRLLMIGGQAAKGCFWDLVEILRESENYMIELNELPGIAYACRFPDGVIDQIVECGLLCKSDTHIWSESLNRRMEQLDIIREKRRDAGRLGGIAKAENQPSDKQVSSKCLANANNKPSKCLARSSDLIRSDLSGSDQIKVDKKIEPPIPPKGFDEFWKAYPKKTGKQAALRAWKRAMKKECREVVIAAVETQKKWPQWTKDNGQYIPNPATWLNQGRWEDEVDLSKPQLLSFSNEKLTASEQQQRRNAEAIAAFRRGE